MGNATILFKKPSLVIKLIFKKLDKIFIKKEFCILSNNCWGGEVYKNLNIQYNTPFVGVYLYPKDLMKYIKDIDLFLEYEVKNNDFVKNDDVITLCIFGVKVYFLHYDSIDEAVIKWNRRTKRLKNFILKYGKKNLIIKICECDSILDDVEECFFRENCHNSLILRRKSFFLRFYKNFPNGVKLFNLRFLYYISYIRVFRNK